MNDLMDMGGHGLYVWSSYAVWLAVILTCYGYTRYQFKSLLKKLRKHDE